jgi:uncharacterized membrane protein
MRTKTFVLGISLSFLQLLDGILTYFGVVQYGVNAEANPLIKQLIRTFGPFLGLFLIKAFAVLVILGWCYKCVSPQRHEKTWPVFWTLIIFYVIFAVIPWVLILWSSPDIGYLGD